MNFQEFFTKILSFSLLNFIVIKKPGGQNFSECEHRGCKHQILNFVTHENLGLTI